ncbi:DUF2798 domain-containing protein [Alishewanella sp. HL-SH06]|nr:DUF2798 domain-containing protein [Alishewanella sp.]
MTFVISLVSTLKALGFNDITLVGWMSAWLWSWLIAFPTLLIVLPIVKKFIQILIMKQHANANQTAR